MSPQLNYAQGPGVARAGQISDERPRTVLSVVSKSNIPYGFFVVRDTTIPSAAGPIPGTVAGGNPSADGARLPSASTDITGGVLGLGVAIETLAIESTVRTSFKNLVQVLASQTVPTAGNIQLNFNGQQTANIAFGDSAATIQTKIAALSNVGTGNVSVTGAFNAGPVVVTFQGTLAGNAVPLMTIPAANNTLTDTNSYPVVPTVFEQIPYTDLPVYPAGHQINCMEKGAAWVPIEVDVTPTSAVYVRYANDLVNYPQSGPGAFNTGTDSSTCALLANARWMSYGNAGGVALLEIDLV